MLLTAILEVFKEAIAQIGNETISRDSPGNRIKRVIGEPPVGEMEFASEKE